MPQEPIHVEKSEEEQQKWIKVREDEGVDVFDILGFDFICMVSEMVGKRICDTPRNETLGEDWNQLPPLPQEPLGIHPLLAHDMSSIMD